MGGGPTRERGRPARMRSRSVPPSFPAMRHPATPQAGTAWARPKQSPGAVAGRDGWRRWPRLREDVCGRDARAPGWASSPDAVAAKEVHRSVCLFLVPLQQPSAVSSSNDLPARARVAPACSRNSPLTALHSSLSGEALQPGTVLVFRLRLVLHSDLTGSSALQAWSPFRFSR